jgi:hypothetical protein
MARNIHYDQLVAAVEPTGMIVRGGFVVGPDDDVPAVCVLVIGNAGGAMWPRFRSEVRDGADPLDAWTRSTLEPIAASFGAAFVHPSDEPFQPFQQWARRADDVWQSPIGLMIHPTYGLWHAYRGAFLFDRVVQGLPPTGRAAMPCLTCSDQPCLSTCPVDAFSADGYDSSSCREHVASTTGPDCLHDGCAARRACPVGVTLRYGHDQMLFHMRAFVGG